MQEVWDGGRWLLGLGAEPKTLTFLQMAKALENTTKGLHWESTETTNGEVCFIMRVREVLPQPIVVPFPVSVELEADLTATYAVRSDGRAVISDANIAKLTDVGIALSLEVRTTSKVLKWRPHLVTSGKVIQALQTAGVKDILELTGPLLLESHPLVQGINQQTKTLLV